MFAASALPSWTFSRIRVFYELRGIERLLSAREPRRRPRRSCLDAACRDATDRGTGCRQAVRPYPRYRASRSLYCGLRAARDCSRHPSVQCDAISGEPLFVALLRLQSSKRSIALFVLGPRKAARRSESVRPGLPNRPRAAIRCHSSATRRALDALDLAGCFEGACAASTRSAFRPARLPMHRRRRSI